MDMIRRFPQYLNAPLQLAWWEADVVAVALFSGYAGFFLKGPFYLIIVLQKRPRKHQLGRANI